MGCPAFASQCDWHMRWLFLPGPAGPPLWFARKVWPLWAFSTSLAQPSPSWGLGHRAWGFSETHMGPSKGVWKPPKELHRCRRSGTWVARTASHAHSAPIPAQKPAPREPGPEPALDQRLQGSPLKATPQSDGLRLGGGGRAWQAGAALREPLCSAFTSQIPVLLGRTWGWTGSLALPPSRGPARALAGSPETIGLAARK